MLTEPSLPFSTSTNSLFCSDALGNPFAPSIFAGHTTTFFGLHDNLSGQRQASTAPSSSHRLQTLKAPHLPAPPPPPRNHPWAPTRHSDSSALAHGGDSVDRSAARYSQKVTETPVVSRSLIAPSLDAPSQ